MRISVVRNVAVNNGWPDHHALASTPLVIVLGSGLLNEQGRRMLRQVIATGRRRTPGNTVWAVVVDGKDPIPPKEEDLCRDLGANVCCFGNNRLAAICGDLIREFAH
jgi:hypothetical protein